MRLERRELLLVLLLHPREDALLHGGHVLVHPVVGPVDLLGVPGERGAVLGREARVRRVRVGARERTLLIERERREELEDEVDLLFLARDALEAPSRRGDRAWRRGRAPASASSRERLGARARWRPGPTALKRSSSTIAGSKCIWRKLTNGFPLPRALVVLALVEADELAEALARAGVHVARAVLVDGLRGALEQLGERDDHARRRRCRRG